MNYIVFDLEWNQSPAGKSGSVPGLPFEIIEIGAVRLDENFVKTGEFRKVIRPEVYRKLNFHVLEVVKIEAEELQNNGESFSKVFKSFLEFCGENPFFCTWGDTDLTQLQMNMAFHGIKNPFPFPLLFYDVQKLYSKLYGIPSRPALDEAAKNLGIEISDNFHRAFEDASYTAKIIQTIDFKKVSEYMSLDYFQIPGCKDEEINLVFPDYSKYVSIAFDTKEQLMRNEKLTELLCFKCNKSLKKKLEWFALTSKQYLCFGSCPVCGYVEGKIRIKRTVDEKFFAIKTAKIISKERALALTKKHSEIAKMRAAKRRLRSK